MTDKRELKMHDKIREMVETELAAFRNDILTLIEHERSELDYKVSDKLQSTVWELRGLFREHLGDLEASRKPFLSIEKSLGIIKNMLVQYANKINWKKSD